MPKEPVLQIQGKEIVRGTTPVRFCGVNYGNWMLVESYMLGLPWTENRMRRQFRETLGARAYHAFWDTYMEAYAADADFAFMHRLGLNLIQCPYNWHHFSAHPASAAFEQRGFEHLDRFVRLCKRHGMYALLAMHAAPGCQARDWNSESDYGETQLWDYAFWQDETGRILREVAARYRDEPAVFGYELPNEPVAEDLDAFHHLNMRLIRAIRSVDPRHIIVVNSNRWGKDIASLRDELFEDPNVMPSFHHYHLQFEPWRDLRRYPGVYRGKRYGQRELYARMAGTFDLKRIRRPHLVGECGVYSGSRGLVRPPHLRMWDDLLGHFTSLGFGWNFWAFKDIGRMGLVYPRRDTPWQRFLGSRRVAAIRESFGRAEPVVSRAVRRHAAFAGDEDLKLIVYGMEHHWDAAALPMVLAQMKRYQPWDLRDMARSFAFANCEVHPQKAAIVRRRAEEVQGINRQLESATAG